MPIYEYLCDNGHRFDRLQRMSDPSLETCEVCGAPVQRVLHPVAIHFKGSGFYATDYGRGKAGKKDEGGGKDGDGSSGGTDAKPKEAAASSSGEAAKPAASSGGSSSGSDSS